MIYQAGVIVNCLNISENHLYYENISDMFIASLLNVLILFTMKASVIISFSFNAIFYTNVLF